MVISEALKKVFRSNGVTVDQTNPLSPDCYGGICTRRGACHAFEVLRDGLPDAQHNQQRGSRGFVQRWIRGMIEEALQEGCKVLTIRDKNR